jgi:membrane protease YdiL (CAAX protease family)
MEPEQTSTLHSDWDALQTLTEHPALVWVVAGVFLAGLAADLWIVLAAFRRRDPTAPTASSFRVAFKPWGLAEVGLILGMVCMLLLVGSLVFKWMEQSGLVLDEDLYQLQLLASGIVLDGIGVLGILLLLHTARIGLREAFGIEARTVLRSVGRGLFFLLAVLPAVWLFAAISQQLCDMFNYAVSKQQAMQLFLESDSVVTRGAIAFMAIVAAPLFEELFFRGLAYPALKQQIGMTAALLVTSLVFAAIHFHVLSFLPLLALAIGLTLAYEATGNLLVPIVMHSVFNLMTIAVMVIVPS